MSGFGAPSQDGFAVAVAIDDARVRDALGRLAAAAGDLTPAMDDIGAGLVLSTQARFEAERDPAGQPWAPLSEVTILRRLGGRRAYTKKGALRKPAERKLAAMKILQDRGHLKGGVVHRADAQGVEVGSDRVYARIHQFGGQAGRNRSVTIPARPFLGLDAADEAMVLDILTRHLSAVAGGGA